MSLADVSPQAVSGRPKTREPVKTSRTDFPLTWLSGNVGRPGNGNSHEKDLLAGLAQYGLEQAVTTVMQREFEMAEPNEVLEAVLNRLATSPLLHHRHVAEKPAQITGLRHRNPYC
jgi:hypothetical protein